MEHRSFPPLRAQPRDLVPGHLGGELSGAEATARALVQAHPAFEYRGYAGRSGAYVVETVCTVLASFFGTDSFESCLVQTVNRGDDADTTGALAGMLAGARFGHSGLPKSLLRRLDPEVKHAIERQTRSLLALSPAFDAGCRAWRAVSRLAQHAAL